MDSFYLWLEDEQKGPFTLAQVQEMWHAGEVCGQTLYCMDGMDKWLPLDNIAKELAKPIAAKKVTAPQTNPPPIPQAVADAYRAAEAIKPLFLLIGEKPEGPFTLAQVRSMWQVAKINMSTMACHEGSKKWTPLGERLDLVEPVNSAPQPVYIQQPAQKVTAAKHALRSVLLAVGVCVVIVFALGVYSTIEDRVKHPEKVFNQEAYNFAAQELKARYVAIERVLPGFQMERDGNRFVLTMGADGRNTFNAPVRNLFKVTLRHDDVGWQCVKVEQQTE